jgi:hypothetical protein
MVHSNSVRRIGARSLIQLTSKSFCSMANYKSNEGSRAALPSQYLQKYRALPAQNGQSGDVGNDLI